MKKVKTGDVKKVALFISLLAFFIGLGVVLQAILQGVFVGSAPFNFASYGLIEWILQICWMLMVVCFGIAVSVEKVLEVDEEKDREAVAQKA